MILTDLQSTPIIAHRGASAAAPENTLEAFHLAVERRCSAFELDVRVTRDGVPVVLHDPTLDRTTDRRGRVSDMLLEEVRSADAGARYEAQDRSHPWAGRGVRIPTLLEVLRTFPTMPIMIEIKDPRAQDAVARLLIDEQAVERCVVASFRSGALRVFRGGPFLVGASRRDILRLYGRTRLLLGPGRRNTIRCYAVPDYWKGAIEVPTAGFVLAARRLNIPVHVWTVDDPGRARSLRARGVSGIITNRPGLIREALQSTRASGA